ncbi:tryptophan aminotransferase-related protein 2-like [Cicer arietinum]|uniref:Tryptophan aminotransferase-related protein 2-like n=1 Tax=Cicer arietinum TaxID=3827 RepID=A0A1S2YBY6_CICAR|nr:tryptophan aminotransferase-related protein 2-like [Cicer arietinum]
MAKISSTVFSLRHFLVLSLALNVSLILRIVYEGEEGHDNSCLKNETGNSISRADFDTKTHNILKSRVVMSSTLSSGNSTCKYHTGSRNKVINLDHGDPTVYERFWRQRGDKSTIIISGWQSMSYFSDVSNICWFLETEFAKEVVRLHTLVGNAVTEGRHIVVGTGSSQLFLAALYALSPQHSPQPINVVCASPYYSSYPSMTDYLKSGLYKWGGNADSYEKEGPYIEVVTSPNNPDGHVRRSKVNRSEGLLLHDLAYYWPQYTPISSPADYDLTLFTLSKTTGHAGMRIGWALVKDKEVAKKMTKFIELNTIGVSKDSQLRAAKVLRAVSDSCEEENSQEGESFFKFSHNLMANRWKQLREVVDSSQLFSLPQFSPAFCNFFNQVVEPQPAFVWLKCEGNVEDCEKFLRAHNIITRSGKHFGVSRKYVRISLLDTDENFNQFVDRLSTIQSL